MLSGSDPKKLNDAAAKLDAANIDRRQQTHRGWDDGCG
jgi:hypothetical protein